MSLHSPTPHPCRSIGVLCLLASALSGCADADSDPLAVLVVAETHGALALADDLPSLPELTRATGSPETLDLATQAWIGSWERREEGEALRMEAYVSAVPSLVESLGSQGVGEAAAAVRSTLDAAEAMDPNEVPGFMIHQVARARALADEADQALGGADLGRAMLLTLEASDVLRALGPEEVARDLLARAAVAIGRNGDGRPYSELELERGRHLLLSAQEAMERQDYLRAIRRAFYACQLLGVTTN